MRHLIAYHNAERMGYANPARGESPGVYTRKRIGDPIADVVWMILGENGEANESSSRPKKRYRLAYWFEVDRVDDSDLGNFKYRLSGARMGRFKSMPLLDGEEWFKELFRSSGRFSRGLHEAKSMKIIEGLKLFAAQNGQPVH